MNRSVQSPKGRCQSGGGPPQSKTLARLAAGSGLREASWTAPAPWGYFDAPCRSHAVLTVRSTSLRVLCACLVAFTGQPATFREDFSSDPAVRGWNVFGQTNLFHWNSTNQNLEATWDSSQVNSFFYRPLGTVLTKDDDFGLAFDLRLSDIAVAVNREKPSTFELAVGDVAQPQIK